MKPKKITESDWTPENIRRLWDWYGTNSHVQPSYFSFLVGYGIVNFLEATGKMRGRVLDYGCGPGHLLSHFLKRTILECYGVDSSKESVLKTKNRLGNHANFKEAVAINSWSAPYPDGFFDVITLVETVEHLSNDAAAAVLGEIKRLIKPGGIIMITTPFAENLEVDSIYCPFCNSEFHKWQHMRSFSKESLASLITGLGLTVEFCENMDFGRFQENLEVWPLNLNKIYNFIMRSRRAFLDWVSPLPFPKGREFRSRIKYSMGKHLCLIAIKTEQK